MTHTPHILVLGAGSIGVRHATNLQSAGARIFLADPDAQRAQNAGVGSAIGMDSVWAREYDGIVVASPTSCHVTDTMTSLEYAPFVLVEKPLGTSSEAVSPLTERAVAERVAVGCNLRFHLPVQRTVEAVRDGRIGSPLAIRIWFGSWLPAWRPATDYRQTYSARRDLGGGVLLDAIHELDLLLWLVGERSEISVAGAVVDRIGDLDVDVEDTVVAVLRDASGCVISLSLDYLSPRYRRGVEVMGDRATARLDWASESCFLEDAKQAVSLCEPTPIGMSYEREAAAFLAWIDGGPALPVDARTGLRALQLADMIREAAA